MGHKYGFLEMQFDWKLSYGYTNDHNMNVNTEIIYIYGPVMRAIWSFMDLRQ